MKGGGIIDTNSIKKLLRKALLYRFMANVDKLILTSGYSHLEISSQTGRKGNWFNDAYNNNEDIRVSSLARILAMIHEKTSLNDYQLSELFDIKVLQIAKAMSNIADENLCNIKEFILAESSLFIDLLGDWGSLASKKKLSDDEYSSFMEIKKLVHELIDME